MWEQYIHNKMCSHKARFSCDLETFMWICNLTNPVKLAVLTGALLLKLPQSNTPSRTDDAFLLPVGFRGNREGHGLNLQRLPWIHVGVVCNLATTDLITSHGILAGQQGWKVTSSSWISGVWKHPFTVAYSGLHHFLLTSTAVPPPFSLGAPFAVSYCIREVK